MFPFECCYPRKSLNTSCVSEYLIFFFDSFSSCSAFSSFFCRCIHYAGGEGASSASDEVDPSTQFVFGDAVDRSATAACAVGARGLIEFHVVEVNLSSHRVLLYFLSYDIVDLARGIDLVEG
jgi:hypothetical protein